MKKKILALLLALTMTFGLAACSGSGLTEALLEEALDEVLSGLESTESQDTVLSPSTEDFVYSDTTGETDEESTTYTLDPDGWYYSAEDVSLYIYTYDCLPENFITKSEAREMGWEGGSVEDYAPGYAIGGDIFGNREGLLPEDDDRVYYECDIDTNGRDSRGAKRIVFSNDGLIYYTEDHYESFTLLYGGD